MAENSLTAEARRENAHALAVAAGLSEEEASARLGHRVMVTYDVCDLPSAHLVAELIPILSRTLSIDRWEADGSAICATELVLGCALPRTDGPYVFALLLADRCIISRTPLTFRSSECPHALMAMIAACYVCGAVIQRAVGDGLPNPPPDEYEISFDAFLPPTVDLSANFDIEDAYLAGAGAIGCGFIWAARHLRLQGRLHIVDYDFVSAGNLQRQIWFDVNDVGKTKANCVCNKAQPFLPACRLVPAVCRLQEHPNRHDGPWLRRLIVAVDSRRARRHLQNELPGEVFDASTTGSEEIVLHYNRQPTEWACLGCVYSYDEAEVTHEQAVAAHLGIGIEQLRKERVDADAAKRICTAHPHLAPSAIEGLAFDTLYKQLCSSAQLKSTPGKQVVAPFAFVSVLAGALLLLEMIQRVRGDSRKASNEWRVNPWRPPVPEMRQYRPRRPSCECCGRPETQRINQMLWRAARSYS